MNAPNKTDYNVLLIYLERVQYIKWPFDTISLSNKLASIISITSSIYA